MSSIDENDPSKMVGICIKCQACIYGCYAGARAFTNPEFISHVEYLNENYRDRKESEFFC